MSGISIGALSKACGIPANTIRTWERRYGFPSPSRTSGGHRLYNSEDVTRLRLIAEALTLGLRAGQIVPASPSTLTKMLSRTASTTKVTDLLSYTKQLDSLGLDRALNLAYAKKGLDEFVTVELPVFLYQLGEAWANGTINVHQEHFASHRIRTFLESIWQPLSTGKGQPIVLATLSGEQHELGLHIAACVIVAENIPVVFLGSQVPADALVESVNNLEPRALILGVSTHTANSNLAVIQELVKALPDRHNIFLGGQTGTVDTGLPVISTYSELRLLCS
jgi:DNA-binding transcriptional MerR regulator